MAYRALRTGGNYGKWDVPKTVEGTIVAFETGEYEGKTTQHVTVRTDDGVATTYPLSAVLRSINVVETPIGGRLRLVYAGKEKGKRGQPYNNFTSVEYDDGAIVTSTHAVGTVTAVRTSAEPNPADIVAAAKAAALAKAKADLAAIEQAAHRPAESEYDMLLAKLVTINPAMAEALPDVYPDMTVRLEKLRAVLKQSGA